MLADMGAPIHVAPEFPPPSKYPRPFARFRAAGAAVRAVFRFRYMCRRKREYLQGKSEKLNPLSTFHGVAGSGSGLGLAPSLSFPRVTFSAPVVSESVGGAISASSEIHVAPGIPTAVSGIGMRPVLKLHSRTKPPSASEPSSSVARKQLGGSGFPTKQERKPAPRPQKTVSHSGSKIPNKLSFPVPRRSASSHSRPKISKKPSSFSSPKPTVGEGQSTDLKVPAQGIKEGSASKLLSSAIPQEYDPQLLEYMEGLERYRTRLSKT